MIKKKVDFKSFLSVIWRVLLILGFVGYSIWEAAPRDRWILFPVCLVMGISLYAAFSIHDDWAKAEEKLRKYRSVLMDVALSARNAKIKSEAFKVLNNDDYDPDRGGIG